MIRHLLLDEMYPPVLSQAISECGHDVLAVAAMADLAGSPDDVVLEAASVAGPCLFTENVRDFAVLIRHIHHHGVLFVNAQRWPRTRVGSNASRRRSTR